MTEARPLARSSWLVVAVAVAVLLLAFGIAWLAIRPAADPVADSTRDERSHAVQASATGDGATVANDPAALGADGAARQAAEVGAAARPVVLRIVDADRRPVPGASVRIDPNAEEIRFLDLRDAEPLLAAIAPRASDDQGLVFAQLPRGVAMVTARKGDAYVQDWVDIEDQIADPIELQVLDDRELVVHTRLGDGTRAPHVPVELSYSWERNVEQDRLDQYLLGRTDERGELVVPHAQRLFRRTPAPPQLLLRPRIVGAEVAATAVSLEALRTRVELLCAPHGAIRGTNYARDGQPFAAPFAPVVRQLRGEGYPASVDVPGWPQARPGEWFLHPLVLGVRWQIEGEPYETLEVVGPHRQGEIVTVQQRRWRTEGRLRCTLQGPDGSLLAGQPVQIDSDKRSSTVHTDHRGGIDMVHRQGERSVRIEAKHLRAHGVLPIPASAAESSDSYDAGVLRLEPQQLLAQGVVVDGSTGAPVHARLEARGRDTPADELARTETAVDGSFELWGTATAPLLVRVFGTRQRELSTELQPGARDVVLRLPALRQLFLTLLFDADIDDEEIDVNLEPRSSWSMYRSEVGVRHQMVPLSEGGDSALVISTAGHALLRVPAAEWQHSPHGASVTVDLRGRLATFTVEATCGGEPVEAQLRLLAGTAEDRAARSIRASTPLVLTTDRSWRALLVPEAGGTIEVPLQRGHNKVEVPGPTRVRCSWGSGAGELGGARVAFELLRLRHAEPLLATSNDEGSPSMPATLDAVRDDERNVTRDCKPPGEEQPGQFWIGRLGRYALFAWLEQDGYEVLLPQPAVEFDVVAFDHELPIVVPLQPAAMATARQQLQAKGAR